MFIDGILISALLNVLEQIPTNSQIVVWSYILLTQCMAEDAKQADSMLDEWLVLSNRQAGCNFCREPHTFIAGISQT